MIIDFVTFGSFILLLVFCLSHLVFGKMEFPHCSVFFWIAYFFIFEHFSFENSSCPFSDCWKLVPVHQCHFHFFLFLSLSFIFGNFYFHAFNFTNLFFSMSDLSLVPSSVFSFEYQSFHLWKLDLNHFYIFHVCVIWVTWNTL